MTLKLNRDKTDGEQPSAMAALKHLIEFHNNATDTINNHEKRIASLEEALSAVADKLGRLEAAATGSGLVKLFPVSGEDVIVQLAGRPQERTR